MRYAVFFALLLLLIPTTLRAQDAAAVPRFEAADCPVYVSEDDTARVRCGVLTVPESRAEGSDPTKTIRLPVAIVASQSDTPAPDPLIFPTTGGPGGTTLGALDFWLYDADWAAQERDIILIEQRGTEFAEPRLNCPEQDALRVTNSPRVLSDDENVAAFVATAQACHDRLVTEGVNLAAYTSAESAADLADLREALGYDQWNIYGISYGGRLAMTVMRDYPDGLRSVILDSPYTIALNRYDSVPPSFSGAVDKLFSACADDVECSGLYPNLETEFYEIVQRHNTAPIPVEVKDDDGTMFTLLLTGRELTGGLFSALYDSDQIRVLPFVIHQIYVGDTGVVQPLAQQNFSQPNYSAAMGYSVECYEEAPFNDPGAIAAAYAAHPVLADFHSFDEFLLICDIWGVPAAPPVENAPVISDIPTLLTTGEFDPIHPAFWSATAAETLSHHYLYDFPAMGHGVIWQNWFDDCGASIAGQFLHDPNTEPDASCIEAMRAPAFLTTNDIYPTSAIYRLNSDVIAGSDPVQIGILAVCLLVFVVALLYGLVSLVWRRRHAPSGAVAFAMLAAGLYLAFVVGLVVVLFNADYLILGFGLPTSARPLLILPFVALAAAVLMIALLARTWLRGRGRTADRFILSITAVASLAFALWLYSRGLLRL